MTYEVCTIDRNTGEIIAKELFKDKETAITTWSILVASVNFENVSVLLETI